MIEQLKIYRAQSRLHGLKSMQSYFFRWKRSLKKGASSVRDEQPWLTFKAIDFLKSHLPATSKVFEYGGGGSTLFFSNRSSELHTVEHDQNWFKVLEQKMLEKGFKGWKGNLVLPEKGDMVSQPDIANPDHYASDDADNKGKNFKAYASVIDAFPDAYFDCVLVDGRARPSCIKHALGKIKTGGFLVLDNSDRDYYLTQTLALITKNYQLELDGFAPCPYLQHFTKTSVWKKVK
jgi:hypothetical protein